MDTRKWLTLAVGAPLLCVGAVQAQDKAPTPPPAAPAASTESTDVQSLKEEIERIRREAEETRKKQEERIKALEEKLEKLSKPETKPATPAPNPVTTKPGFKARLYGFARADMDLDSRKMFAHPHLPFWVLSPDDSRAGNRRDGAFTIHPRLSRLGLDTEAPPLSRLGDAKLSGKLEVDFFNFAPGVASATSNSRQFLRIRHAYGELQKDNVRFLFGQTWDLISPLYPSVNPDVLMWNAGNLGDRRPQFRATWEPKAGPGKVSFGIAALSADAVGGSNRDADLVLDGESSGRPLFQTRLAYNRPLWVKGQNAELGFWYHNGQYRFQRVAAINGVRSFESNAIGLDLRIPLTQKLLLQGEAFAGRGLADIRGGVGQDINAITGQTIHSKGAWGELSYQFNPVYTLGAGFTLDNPEDSEVTPFTGANHALVGRTINRTLYIANRFNLGSGFVFGVDWMLFNTHFRGLSPGSNSRINAYLQHSF